MLRQSDTSHELKYRDRFASIGAGSQPGTLTTRPLDIAGTRLHVNARVADGGSLRVAVLSHEGKPFDGFDATDCTPISGNKIDLPVSWSHNKTIDRLKSQPLRLRFDLRDAELYSFWFD